MYICNQNFIRTIQSLLDRGYNVDKKNSDGETALHLATKECNYEMYYEIMKLFLNVNFYMDKNISVCQIKIIKM